MKITKEQRNYEESKNNLLHYLNTKAEEFEKEYKNKRFQQIDKVKKLSEGFAYEIELLESKEEKLLLHKNAQISALKNKYIQETSTDLNTLQMKIKRLEENFLKRSEILKKRKAKLNSEKDLAIKKLTAKQKNLLVVMQKDFNRAQTKLVQNIQKRQTFLEKQFALQAKENQAIFAHIESKINLQKSKIVQNFQAKQLKIVDLTKKDLLTKEKALVLKEKYLQKEQSAHDALYEKKYLPVHKNTLANKSYFWFFKATDTQANEKRLLKVAKFINDNKLIFALLIFAIIVGILRPRFFSANNWLLSILRANVFSGLLALGMTFIILTGAIDLSVGSGLGLVASITLVLTNNGYNLFLALFLSLLVILLLGFLMGFLISYANFQPFIVTLIGLLSFSGVSRLLLNGRSLSTENAPFFNFFGTSNVGVLPVSVLFFFILVFITFVILRYTKYGRYIYATGSNKVAARASGIRVKLIALSVFLISAFFVAFAAIIFLSNVGSTSPTTGNGFELDAIAAVVLGGTSLLGGKGGVIKTLIGWLVISILGNTLVFLNVDSNFQLIVRGVVILIAITLDSNLNLKEKTKIFYKKMRSL